MAAASKDLLEKIDRYLMNRMDGDELRDFEMQISNDPELRKEVEFERLINESIRFYRRQQFKTYLIENATTKLMGNVWGKSWTRISAIVIIIMGLVILWLKYVQPDSSIKQQDIYRLPDSQTEPVKDPPVKSDTTVGSQHYQHNVLVDEELDEEDMDEEDTNIGNEIDESEPQMDDDWSMARSRLFASDSIKMDYKILDTLVFVFKADSVKLANSTLAIISINTEDKVFQDEPLNKVYVELWQSPVNFRGYRWHDQRLQLYGFMGLEDKRFFFLNGLLYMETASALFEMKEGRSFNQLRPVEINREKP